MRTICFLLIIYLLSLPLFAHEHAWVDLPENIDFLPESIFVADHELLKSKISQYHKLDKQSESLLIKRIELLDSIAEIVQTKERLLNSSVRTFHQLVNNKKWYLQKLHDILTFHLDSYDSLHTFFTQGVDRLPTNGSLHPLILVNKPMFDPNMGDWGLFWLEALDPCHRQIAQYYKRWQNLKGKKPHFFLWLETENVPFYAPTISFLADDELTQKHVRVEAGILVNNSGPLQMEDKDKQYIFVIDLNKTFLISEATHQIRHVSLSHAKPLLAAGTIKVRDGHIEYLSMESGHYLPSKHFAKQTLELLQSFGVDVFTNATLDYFENGTIRRTTLNEFLREELIHSEVPINYLDKAEFLQGSSLRAD